MQVTVQDFTVRERILLVGGGADAQIALRDDLRANGVDAHQIDLLESQQHVLSTLVEKRDSYRIIVLMISTDEQSGALLSLEKIRAASAGSAIVLVTEKRWHPDITIAGIDVTLTAPASATQVLACARSGNSTCKRMSTVQRNVSDPCARFDEPRRDQCELLTGPEMLLLAVQAGDLNAAQQLLAASTFSIAYAVDGTSGNTALHFAARCGNVEMMRTLVDFGAEPNAVSRKGYTPLHVAAWVSSLDCVKFLVSKNCSPLQKSFRGVSAVDIAVGSVSAYFSLLGFSRTLQPTRPRKHRARSQPDRLDRGPIDGTEGYSLRAKDV